VRLGDIDLFDVLTAPIVITGGEFAVKQDGATSLETGAYEDAPKGTVAKFEVTYWDELRAAEFRKYCVANRKEIDIRLFNRDKGWYYRVWGISISPGKVPEGPRSWLIHRYNVTCYLYSPYAYATLGSLWQAANVSLPQSSGAMQNGLGHYAGSFESLMITCAYDGGHVKALALANTAGDSIILVTEALTNEVWELRGNENKLLETYEDPIDSATIFNQDTVGDGAWYAPASCIFLVAGESFYYLLSSPHQVNVPVKMTAAFNLASASDLCTVDISSDGVSWETVLDESDFGVQDFVAHEYRLGGTEYMRNVYIRFSCTAGSPVSVNLASIKFEVERWIELDAVPVVEPGDSSVFTLSCNETYGDLVSIDGIFRAKRLHD
jgi:hypothetical protein